LVVVGTGQGLKRDGHHDTGFAENGSANPS
jgi:hypothetical protein